MRFLRILFMSSKTIGYDVIGVNVFLHTLMRILRKKEVNSVPPILLIDNCGLFIRHEEYKSQATSYKYRLRNHSPQQSRRQYSKTSWWLQTTS